MNTVRRYFRNLVARLGIARELLAFFCNHKLWWFAPLGLIILIAGVLVIFGQSEAVSAFIYSLF